MTKIQAFGLACYQHESGAEQISMQDEIRIDLAALAGASPAWQPIETAPKDAQLLLAAEFDHPGDWRIKMGYFDSKTAKWAMWGASWRPTRWMRLPPGPGAAVQAPAPAPEGFALVPDYRGYAHLGTGQYVLNHSAAGEPPEVIISVATEEEKAGRAIGEERDNPPGHVLQPDAMAVRLRFANPAGLAALENEIRKMRETHGWACPMCRSRGYSR